ncbi:epoxide hydrolase 4-like [Arctopsyche grandis]|uniref:epoxide hydrolase 4-like n=1 Tax=Arctopsyche grandis TaxID=121162 RepID=UPI00406D6DB4
MNPVKLFFFKCFIYVFTLIYSIGFCFWLLFYFVTHPAQKFWKIKNREKPPQCLLDQSWGQHGFMQLKDVRLHYVENGDRSKPLMLFIHGFPEFWYSWRYQIREFSKDYWTVALDLRGYGESDKPQSTSAYKMKLILQDIHEFVLGLGREKMILIGHDWGGILVWNFMDYYSHMVDRFVVINSPHHRTWTSLLVKSPKQFIISWYCFFFQMPFLPEFGLSLNDFQKFHIMMNSSSENGNKYVTNDDLEVFKYMFSKPNALTYPLNYYRANCGELYVKEKPLQLYPRGMLLFGENDGYLKLNFLDLAKKEVPNLKTFIVHGANHFVQQDNPVKVNKAIDDFINDRMA